MHDLRLAFRQIATSPSFSAVVVLTLALGIGACTAVFSVINAIALRPLPFPEAEQLVQVWDRPPEGGAIYTTGLMYRYWHDENTTFTDLAAVDPAYRTLTGGHSPERVKGLVVSANYLRTLGVQPLLGRDFAADADKPGGANHVVILSHAFWFTRFGGDPGIIDRTIMLDQVPHVVIGVLAPESLPRDDALFVMPVVLEAEEGWRLKNSVPWATVTGRLKPGVTVETAEAELSAISAAHAGEFPETRRLAARVVQLRDQLVGNTRMDMLMLGCAAALVLLIACANVANLLLARATARTKEMAVRAALGADARRIIRLVLTENILLAMLGGALGVFLAVSIVDVLGATTRIADPAAARFSTIWLNHRLTGGDLPGMLSPEVDWTVLAFAAAIALVTGIVCGLIPARRACRVDLNRDLKGAGRGSTSGGRTRVQSALVAIEVGLTTVLLVGAGLFLRSFTKVMAVDPGFMTRDVSYFDLALSKTLYPSPGDVVRFSETVVRQIAEQPGIEAAGLATNVPFGPTGWGGQISRADETDRSLDVTSGIDYVVGDFFGAMGIPLLRGRLFTPEDNDSAGPRVAVVSQALAKALFGDRDPIGERVAVYGNIWQIVGIVGNTRNRSLEQPDRPFFYGPHAFDPGQAFVVVRSALPAPALREVVTKAVRRLDPDQPVALHAIASGIEQSVEGRQSMMVLVDTFAIIALLLACLGIHGVMAYTIGQRQREISIRLALGASQPNVFRMVLRDGLRLGLIGLAAGLAVALVGAQMIASLLYGVSAHDPLVYVGASAVLWGIASLACWLPARRAALADPIQALRTD